MRASSLRLLSYRGAGTDIPLWLRKVLFVDNRPVWSRYLFVFFLAVNGIYESVGRFSSWRMRSSSSRTSGIEDIRRYDVHLGALSTCYLEKSIR